MCFGQKVNAQQQVKHKNPFRSRVLKSGPLAPKADALPLSQLRISIVVMLLKCFDAIGRNVNKQSQTCVPHFFNKFMFSVIFLHA